MDGNTIKIVIAEDETPAREELLHLLKDIKDISISGIAKDGLEAKKLLESGDADLALLDIDMPGIKGIDLARQLMNQKSNILCIFTTAYDAFAIEAFEVHAIDYLLKPLRPEKLKNAIERARVQLKNSSNERLKKWESFFQSYSEKEVQESPFLSVYQGDQIIPIKISSIIFAEARGRFVWVATKKGEFKTTINFSEAEEILHKPDFFACHRSFIICLDSIEAIDLCVNNSYTLKVKGSDSTIPVSRSHIEEFRKLMRI